MREQLDALIQQLITRVSRLLVGAVGVGVALGMGATGGLMLLAALLVLQQSVQRGLGLEMSLNDLIESSRGLMDRLSGAQTRALGYRDRFVALRQRLRPA